MAALLIKYSAPLEPSSSQPRSVLVELAAHFSPDSIRRGPLELAWSRA